MKQAFERVLIVMFENQYRNYVLKDRFMQKLARAGANMGNYFGAFHPSQTNYIASLAAEVCSVTNDQPPVAPLMQQTLVDLLEQQQVSWKAYMEGLPNEPWNPKWTNPDYPAEMTPIKEFPNDGTQLARYFRKHNAFASFHNIQKDKNRWAKIVDEHQFWKDVSAKKLPQYSWFTPDIWNDGHYLYNTHTDTNPRTQLIPQLAGWLEYVFFADIASNAVQGGQQTGLKKIGLNLDIDLLIENPKKAWETSHVPSGTLIVITFDEADFNAVGYDTSYEGPNQIYTVLLGDMIEPGTVIDTPYNHYSLMKTIEQNFELGTLQKNDEQANWFKFMWGEDFKWKKAKQSKLEIGNALAGTNYCGTNLIAFENSQQEICTATFEKKAWSKPFATGMTANGQLAVASLGEVLHLVFTDKKGRLFTASKNGNAAWSKPRRLGPSNYGSMNMINYVDTADGKEKLMLCWQAKKGFIKYLIYQDGAWQKRSKSTGQLTDGPIVLGQLGASLYLVYKARNTRGLRLTSYNLAPFNAFEAKAFNGNAALENNTSLHKWSPADMPVGNFSRKFNALQHQYLTIGQLGMASIEGEMHLVHRGPYADTPEAYTSFFGLTGIFTAANELTNGYGTIDQAGWTAEKELKDVQTDPESPVCMISNGQQLMVVWREQGGSALNYKTGGY